MTGKTFAVFRVDPTNHLVSFVSMIDPSPDWFVGVTGLELCLRNCTWSERKILELYPWDAGTDSGATYIVINYLFLIVCLVFNCFNILNFIVARSTN